MSRPRLFISTVSEELRSARQTVTATVRTLGYDPVTQDDFPTGHGELLKWLRAQIDSSAGLIQLVGQAYGAEPPGEDPDFGRVSYTQFEFLHARRQGKKTWIIMVGDGCRRDKPIDQLDLPRDPDHPDPAAYQAERAGLQKAYIARLHAENLLRHHAATDDALQLVIFKLHDELGELRKRDERRLRRLSLAILAILLGLGVLGGSGWWVYKALHKEVQQVGVVDTEKIRVHLYRTIEETRQRELAEAEATRDWQERQRRREAVEAAYANRKARIEELSASFAEIEGCGTATSVFQEMTRILAEQGVDEAIAFEATKQATILENVRTRTAAARERNRVDLEPLLKAAGLHETKGQPDEARILYNDILALEPDWQEALHAAFWFSTAQGDHAVSYATLPAASHEYDEAQRLAQRLVALDSCNSAWQRDLWVTYWRLAKLAEDRHDEEGARVYWKEAFALLSGLDARGVHLSPQDRMMLKILLQKAGSAQ